MTVLGSEGYYLYEFPRKARAMNSTCGICSKSRRCGKHVLIVLSISLILFGCASTQEIRDTNVAGTFNSKKSAQLLTLCLDKNTDGTVLNSLLTNIKPIGVDSFEIVVRNGSLVNAVVEVRPAGTGSVALFRFGGVGAMAPATTQTNMTKNCE